MKSGLGFKTGKGLLVVSLLSLLTACNPATKFTMVDDSIGSLGAIDGASPVQGEAPVVDGAQESAPVVSAPVVSAPAAGGSVASAPLANQIIPQPNSQPVVILDDVPFSFDYNRDDCVDFSNDDLKFNLIKDDKGMIRSAQVTSICS